MAIEKVINVEVKTGQSVKEVRKLNTEITQTEKQTEAVKKSTNGLVNSLDKMSGGAITAFRGMVSGAKSGVVAMKSLKFAIAATGIGILVLAVASLITYFTQTQRGADLVKKAFSAIGATVSVLVDRISGFGEGLALIFSGKYKEGADKLKASMQGIGAEIVKESKAAWDLQDALQAVEDREISLIKVNARKKASIESLRLAAEDETKSQKERADALRQAMELQNEISDSEIAIAKERARISQEQLNLGESTREEIRANEELQAKVIDLEASRDRSLKRVATRLNAFTKVQKDSNKSVEEAAKKAKEAEEAEIKRIQAIEGVRLDFLKKKEDLDAKTEEDKLELERQRAQESLNILIGSEAEKREAQLQLDAFFDQKEIELEQSKQDQLIALREEAEDARTKLEEKQAEERKVLEQSVLDAKIAIVLNGLELIRQIAGEDSKIGKGLAAAQTVIQGIQGVQSAYTTAQASPITTLFPAYPLVQAGLAGAFSALQLKKILSTDPTGKSTPNMGGSGGGGGGAQAPSFNVVGTSGTNQIAQQLGQEQQPVQAYVVGSNVTTQQALDRNIVDTATIG